jgi:hypothetical protein
VRRPIALPEFDRRVQLCADPAAQAERIVAVACDDAQAEGMLGVGGADTDVLPLAENAPARRGRSRRSTRSGGRGHTTGL